MSKMINDKAIKESESIHEYSKLIRCHNAWVNLYDNFMSNPVLLMFYNMAKEENPLAEFQNSKIFLMKRAVYLMAEYIEKSLQQPTD